MEGIAQPTRLISTTHGTYLPACEIPPPAREDIAGSGA
jgi:hypothetical protein